MRILIWIKETMQVAILVVLLLLVSLAAFVKLPEAIVKPSDLKQAVPSASGLEPGTQPTAVDLVQARNSVRVAVVALIAGIGTALATGFAARTFYLSRRGQLMERLTAATTQLGKSDPTLQASAVSALDGLARESALLHKQAMEALTAFLRSYDRPHDTEAAPPAVQSAFTALAQRRTRYDRGLVVDLAGADLRQVDCRNGAKLRGAVLTGANLAGAFLHAADLRKANLTNARAASARLDSANLRHAILEGTQLQSATLDSVDARFAHFEAAELDRTYLRAADLRHATGLPVTDHTIAGARISEATQMPSKRTLRRRP